MTCTRCFDHIEAGATVYRVACGRRMRKGDQLVFEESHESAVYCAPCWWHINRQIEKVKYPKKENITCR